MESIAWAMSSAVRVPVPLNSMCSTKWAMPLRSTDSCREPRVSQTPRLTDRTCGIDLGDEAETGIQDLACDHACL